MTDDIESGLRRLGIDPADVDAGVLADLRDAARKGKTQPGIADAKPSGFRDVRDSIRTKTAGAPRVDNQGRPLRTGGANPDVTPVIGGDAA